MRFVTSGKSYPTPDDQERLRWGTRLGSAVCGNWNLDLRELRDGIAIAAQEIE